MIKVAPSILSADFSKLGDEIKKVSDAGADCIHIDVMDGRFVPNITLGAPIVKCVRHITKKPFDVHLMIEHPEDMIESFSDAGADIITFHVEATHHSHRLIQAIKKLGCRAGVAINPATPACMVEPIIEDIDMVLVMTVNPGFGGQKFIPSTLRKIRDIRNMADKCEHDIDIEVDGGINDLTAKDVIAAGANVLVAGSYVYGASDVKRAIASLR
ncbi:MAG: ribulose-phosphate 3-epimerase [Schwartzia sp.]|nr:ribulose-phosphate 3-epimerase [Schwartzia sp. (in: firmicutes)]